MKIEKKILYHVFTKHNEFEYEQNYTYPIGNGPNYFWKEFCTNQMRYMKEPYIGKYAAKLASLHFQSPLLSNMDITKDIMSFLASSVCEMGMLIRELVFEEYRKNNYPELPSRQTALYLMDEDIKNHWISTMKRVDCVQKIITFECSGEIHKGSSYYLNSDSFSYSEYLDNANKYWTSVNLDNKYEILFSGNAKVLSIEKM